MTRTTGALLTVLLVVLAGCAGGIGGPTTSPAADGATDGTDGTSTDSARINFYISDEKNAIGDFRHLNVTITSVGLHRVDGESAEDGETATGTETTVTSAANETTTTSASNETTATTETADGGSESGDGDATGDGEWVEYDVNDTTVDLTELQGANATRLDVINASAGTYDKVFVYVSEVNATLDDGTHVNVKLPSQKLHINKRFTVSANSTTDFVFDISVHKAGKSGKYILKPVVSQSGTSEQVDIQRVGDTESASDAASLHVETKGPVRAGENVTVKVTRGGDRVANATVRVDGTVVGQTDARGTISVTVPDADEMTLRASVGNATVERTVDIPERGGGGQADGNGNGNPALTDPTAAVAGV